MRKAGVCVAVVLSAAFPGQAADFEKWFAGNEGAFVLEQSGRFIRFNEKRCASRFSPCSTFKIPNAIIGLEAGVIDDGETLMRWTPQLFHREGPAEAPYDAWMRDHTLRSAMTHSVLWYFQEIARRVGEAGYAKHLASLEYGNRDISGGLDRFWLSSSLAISADEQVEFLRKLHAGRLPASERSTRIVRDILVLEDTPEYRLSGKTGTGPLPDGRYLGWLVGYVERRGEAAFFALNLEGRSYRAIGKERRLEMVKGILEEEGILPEAGPFTARPWPSGPPEHPSAAARKAARHHSPRQSPTRCPDPAPSARKPTDVRTMRSAGLGRASHPR